MTNALMHLDFAFREPPIQDEHRDLVLHAAWLPLVVWDEITVVKEVSIGLTVFERYVLEGVLALGICSPSDLLEIASIPSELAIWLLMSLEHKGLVFREESSFLPNAEVCAAALEQDAVLTFRREKASFLWLPESGELVLLSDPGSLFRRLRNLVPSGSFPISADLAGLTRGQLITRAIESGEVIGADAGVLREALDDAPVPNSVPAYQVRGTISVDAGSRRVQLAMVGPRKARNLGGNGPTSDTVEIDLPLPELATLPSMWRGHIAEALRSCAPEVSSRYPGCSMEANAVAPSLSLDDPGVSQLASTLLLIDRLGLEIWTKDAFHCELSCVLESAPGSDRAEHIRVRDKAVRQLLCSSSALTRELLDQVCQEHDADADEVIDRLWQIRQYRRVYELRQAKDFSDASLA